MTEHLPECPRSYLDCDEGKCQRCDRECICEQLRACEARVLREAQLRVAAMRDPWPVTAPGTIRRSEAIAAITFGGWRA